MGTEQVSTAFAGPGGRSRRLLTRLLERADVRVNGDRPWDVRVHDRRWFARVLAEANLGLGESYMDGWWDCPRLDEFFCRVIRARIHRQVDARSLMDLLAAKWTNRQSRKRSRQVAERHYDLGNELFVRMLDGRMQYTCGYWRSARTLDEAQTAKLDLVARKLALTPGMEILELGGGFGGFAQYAAERYGCRVVSYNISGEQVALARERCAGLPVEIVHADYREAAGRYDRVVSIGLTEHIGPKNYRSYLKLVSDCLRDDGLFLLHSLGTLLPAAVSDPWFRKHIFPEGYLPTIRQLGAAAEGLLVMEDWHNFGADYDPTLMAWHDNFVAHWEELKHRFDQRFFRMWRYYLLSCAGAARARDLQLWQIVFSKGRPGVYPSVR